MPSSMQGMQSTGRWSLAWDSTMDVPWPCGGEFEVDCWHLCTAQRDGQTCFAVLSCPKSLREVQASGLQAYCPVCGERFWGSMGVLLEIRSDDNFWLRATYDGDLNDIKGMFLEGDTHPVAISEELFQKFEEVEPYLGRNIFLQDMHLSCERDRPNISPSACTLIMKSGARKCHQRNYIMSLPVWEVSELVAFVKMRFLSHRDARAP